MNIQSFKGREKARRYVMQALYSWVISNNNLQDIEKYYLADRNPKKFDLDYWGQIVATSKKLTIATARK